MRDVPLRTVGWGRGVLLVALAMSLTLAGRTHSETNLTTLEVKGTRPVLRAIMDLESKYGYVITYEDPRYVYQGDLRDTTKERRDLYRWAPGKAPKTVVPVGGSLALTLPSGTAVDESTMYGIVQHLLGYWLDSNQGGAHFEVEQEGAVFHIVPTEVRNTNGNWQPTESVLTIPISLPSQPRTERMTFRAIGEAISAAAGVKVAAVLNSGFVVGPPETAQYSLGAHDEQASSVLMRAIKMVGKKMSWYLWYDSMAHDYLLNVYDMQAATATTTPSVKPSAPRPQVPSGPQGGCPPHSRSPACPGSP